MSKNLKDKLTVVVLGRSGSGKGTQARFIVARLKKDGVHHMETGRFLRELLQKDNVTTILAREMDKKGSLFPSWFPVYTWLREIIEHGYADRHFVFDGAPRRLSEAKLLDEVIEWHGRSLPLCIYVDVSRTEARKRLLNRMRSGSRADDNPKAIENRLDYFPRDVIPVIHYYQKHNRLVRVNGEQAPELVAREIDAALAKRLRKLWPSPSRQKRK